MDAAKVTLTATPAEFDLVRRALQSSEANFKSMSQDTNLSPKDRRDAAAETVKIADLRRKWGI